MVASRACAPAGYYRDNRAQLAGRPQDATRQRHRLADGPCVSCWDWTAAAGRLAVSTGMNARLLRPSEIWVAVLKYAEPMGEAPQYPSVRTPDQLPG